MPVDALLLRKTVVLGSALIYWVGVFLQASRVRRRIGRSPNLKPKGLKEQLLWLGWFLVIAGWFGQPLLLSHPGHPFFSLIPFLFLPAGLVIGVLMVSGGYAGTLWCYAALGDAWRMGIRRREKTTLVQHGPYQWVRHPIYLFQTLMLIGVILLLPTPFLLFLLGLHLVCIYIKAVDEETYLLNTHGTEYRDYLARSGRFWPGRGR